MVNGVPILLNEDNSVFRIADYVGDRGYGGASDRGGVLDRTHGLRRLYRSAVARLSNAYIGRTSFSATDAIARVRQEKPDARILVIGAGDVDFVEACSARLPMMTISEMLGVPESDRKAVAHAAEKLFSMSDDEYSTLEERATATINEMLLLSGTGIELAKHRRVHPADDLMTAIVNAEVDGQRLTDEEVGAFLVLLASAGNDTTKQTTTHAMLALAAHPEQREWLMADFDARIGSAIEEFVRWATPVMQFARTATCDTELGGQQVRAGDKIGLFYCSANRDEAAFDRPGQLDLSRSPNPHLGFGGGGPHYCLGASLAKTELRHLLRELLTRIDDIEFGQPVFLQSGFVHGIKRVPARIG